MLLHGLSPTASASGTSGRFLLIVLASGEFAGLLLAWSKAALAGSRGTLPHSTVSGGEGRWDISIEKRCKERKKP